MEFDKNRVYTALNADELAVGSKVIVADILENLRNKVQSGAQSQKLTAVLPDNLEYRFSTGQEPYALAYLVEEPDVLKWTDLKVGDTVQKDHCRCMVTRIDADHDIHVHINSCPMSDDGLKQWRKVND